MIRGREMFLNPWYSGQQPQQASQDGSPPSIPPKQPNGGPSAASTAIVPNGSVTLLENGLNINHVTHNVNHVTNHVSHVTRSPAPSPRLPPRHGSLDNRNMHGNMHVEEVQRRLRSGWTVHTTPDGRYYYCK